MRNLVLGVSLLATLPLTVSTNNLPSSRISDAPLGELRVTSYRSVPLQTDGSPHYTSIGMRTNQLGVAVSQDLLCKVNKRCRRNIRLLCNPNDVHYGDVLWIEGHGFRQVFDVMNARHQRSLDLWVPSYEAEKRVGVQRRNVVLVREQ